MGHPFRIREIAQQAGLSEATVDRVLNRRGGVRTSTVQEVQRAVEDLRRQRSQLRLVGRTFLVDLVMHSPARFSGTVRKALERQLPLLQPATFRSRFHLWESGTPGELAAVLDRIAARSSHGVILKAPDVPEVVDAVARLADRGVPVVTLVTDLPASRRVAYVGMDNRAAGATAAYLVRQWLGEAPGAVLVTLSSSFFRGEEEREIGFRTAMRAGAAGGTSGGGRQLVDITETEGLDDVLRALAVAALRAHPDLVAAYSIGGGNQAIVDAFDELGRDCRVLVAHDLDDDNLRLLHRRRVSAVLHHDLRLDMHNACLAIMRAHGALPGPVAPAPSAITVVTPFNLPPE